MLIWVAQPFTTKAEKWIRGRRKIWKQLCVKKFHGRKIIWVHCASLGEFEQGRPVIEEVKIKYPQYAIVLSFFSPSGYEIRKNYPYADQICYLPLDTEYNARKFISIIKPDLAIFVKYDFWFNYLQELNGQHIPFIFISSVFRENHFLLNKWASSFLTIFSKARQIFVQDKVSFDLLDARHCSVTIAGDTRIDRVIQLQSQLNRYPALEKIASQREVIVFGSIWPVDLSIVSTWINKNIGAGKYAAFIAPHDIGELMLGKVENTLDQKSVRFSKLQEGEKSADIVIVDTIGDLAHLYALGHTAYIGGGFGSGIHSILEPVAAGLPVVFGPNHQKFNEAAELIRLQSAINIATSAQFAAAMESLENRDRYQLAKKGIQQFLNSHQGATAKIMDYLDASNIVA